MEIYAIIPARGGSKGIPRKNVKILNGYPLIAYSIAVAKLSKKISRIIVSTDSDEIAATSMLYGAECPFRRPKELALDNSKDYEFMINAINWFEQNEHFVPGYWVHLRPTTPLRKPEIIDSAIKCFQKNQKATCLRSAHQAPESPYKWFKRDEKGWFVGISDKWDNDTLNNPRQEFPDIYIPDGYVDVLKTSFIRNENRLHGKKILGFESPFCIEVDAPDDFALLEYQMNKDNYDVFTYLKNNFRAIKRNE